MKNTRFILLFLITMACNNKDKEKKEAIIKLEKYLNVQISDSVSITDIKYSFSYNGDYTETFLFHFSKEEFEQIFNITKPIKSHIFETELYSIDSYNSEKLSNTSVFFDPNNYTIRYSYGEE